MPRISLGKARFKGARPSVHTLDVLWGDCIKLRAKNRSEYSGKSREGGHTLHPHHILGKPNYSLRYDLSNGVCITGGEHFYIAHNTNRQNEFTDWACKLRGINREDMILKGKILGGVDLFTMYEYLKQKRKEYQNA